MTLLTTYQVLWDYLDSLSETVKGLTREDTTRLHFALIDAVDPAGPVRDYYGAPPVIADGGYLLSLVQSCRGCCRALPSFHMVAPLLRREAARIDVQAINHTSSPARRALELQAWVARSYRDSYDVAWFELAAAAGANIAIYALLALAAESACSPEAVKDTYDAYFPWAGALATMLDGFVDQFDDVQNGEHCYIGYYRSPERAASRIGQLTFRFLSAAQRLEHHERHTLIIAAMIAMYLSRDSARVPPLRNPARHITASAGSLTHLLLPILRLWRITNNTRSF